MPDLNALRALAKARQRSVNNKISRIKNQEGALIKGTQFDPRKPASDISKMNSRQVRSYINKLNKFMDRQNQFVGGAQNLPIPRFKFNRFVEKQSIVNRMANERNAKINVLPMPGNEPGTVNTIGHTKSMQHEKMKGLTANEPFIMHDLDPKRIRGVEAIDKLVARAEKQSSPRQLKRAIKQHRHEIDKALEIMGENEYRDELKNLSDFQFDALWSVPGYAERVFASYEARQKSNMVMEDDSLDESREFLEWARGVTPPKI